MKIAHKGADQIAEFFTSDDTLCEVAFQKGRWESHHLSFDFAANAATLRMNGEIRAVASTVRAERTLSLSKGKSKHRHSVPVRYAQIWRRRSTRVSHSYSRSC